MTMKRNTDRSGTSKTVRAALALIALLPLAACGAGNFANDPFGDAAAGCGDDRGAWRPGCATQRNIATLAEHPGDLNTPRGEGPRDSMRRDALISGYAHSSAGGEPRAPVQPVPTSGGGKEP
jgi:hypothetical protein